ncbi:hypothetical protein [Candidatus Enterococcus courvalinii]|uniref:Ricin B lectin domain-containing protein n=1 Tax=Candidatus Enterococcus courvalinii TaxID=2815329 RepID=A0ABS3HX79_9ENTE|nr:hypothetical protein [Enterococcus sp. MSG2901]MBO0481064.1 hypothetical protein [Enterococcus sp. MSG2901]
MKKGIKSGLAIFTIMVFGIVSGNQAVSASTNDAGAKYDDKLVTIQSVLDPWWVVDYDTETSTISTDLNQGIDSQKWLMSYNEQEDAYFISSHYVPDALDEGERLKYPKFLIASSVKDEQGNEVINTEVEYPNERSFWRLVEDNEHKNGEVYYLENVFNGKMMDAPKLHLGKKHQLITFPKNGGDNQKWLIQVEEAVDQN